ncbi:copper-binding protein [Paraburkholderia sp. MMS20-SJTN17]|uniref:Copper-binding protein n=1 Tax=Paraburkholderia translucens TaxID=2886945 RepID=A0ABS8KH12_9BURK|nr:copper-binding protein [Paraburkholderia sp. MMS20-SJTN17]MCC8404030.1 copper-binding protein [Paraburkholderia sp. MMS20-SJTN17]
MKRATIGAAVMLAAVAAAQPARAQGDMASAPQQAVSGAPPVHMTAEVVGIDAGDRALTLKGSGGNVVIVLVSQQAASFDQLKIGDRIDVLYRNALLTKAEKVGGAGKGSRERIDRQSNTPASGGYESARQTEVLATVLKIDRKQRLVTLRGAYQTQTFEAAPDVDLSDVKVGDTLRAAFVSAAAVEVTPLGR